MKIRRTANNPTPGTDRRFQRRWRNRRPGLRSWKTTDPDMRRRRPSCRRCRCRSRCRATVLVSSNAIHVFFMFTSPFCLHPELFQASERECGAGARLFYPRQWVYSGDACRKGHPNKRIEGSSGTGGTFRMPCGDADAARRWQRNRPRKPLRHWGGAVFLPNPVAGIFPGTEPWM